MHFGAADARAGSVRRLQVRRQFPSGRETQIPHFRGGLMAPLQRTLAAAGLGFLLACGGGGGSSSSSSSGVPNADITIAVTDSPSTDIASFKIRITALQIRRAGGPGATAIHSPVDVDLAQLGDASQLTNTLVVPAGPDTSAVLTV